MIKPRTAGEFVELLDAGRLDEIDPVWLRDTYNISLSTIQLLLMPDGLTVPVGEHSHLFMNGVCMCGEKE